MQLSNYKFLKIFFLLLFAACLQVNARGLAQNITLSIKNASLLTVLSAIEKQADISFIYDKKMVQKIGNVSIEASNQALETVLTRLFRNKPVDFKVSGNYIVLSAKVSLSQGQVANSSGVHDPAMERDTIRGKVTDSTGRPLSGATVKIRGQKSVVLTDIDGNYAIMKLNSGNTVLEFSYVGYASREVTINNRSVISVQLSEQADKLDDVLVVGYGIQKKSDITGAVSSLRRERLEKTPNTQLVQALQGAIAGVQITNSTAGASPSNSIMVRGRNSITAGISPLIVVDGVAGGINDVNPGDVESVEVLKDASAAAIYGSRGSNGVILVTTKAGKEGKTKLRYNGYYSTQRFANLPDMMNAEEFYNFKMERFPSGFTPSELAIHESGKAVDWLDLALRNGKSTQHNLSLSGGNRETRYYISASVTDVQGLAINDDYMKLALRINLESKFKNWLTLGTKTQLAYSDEGGLSPTWDGDNGVFWMNPLTTAYDANGDLTIYPWPEDTYFRNPLHPTLAKNISEDYQVVSNNYAVVDFPFVKGLQYRINTGIRLGFSNDATYYGRNTQPGLANRGDANTARGQSRNIVLENILNYNRKFDKHSVFVTGLYSFENARSGTNSVDAQGFPNDFLSWYGADQAELVVPGYSNSETSLISAMARINYSYDSRYLLTLTGRRDGYSGFGSETKWGFFPSAAIGWNIANESFFNYKNVFSQLKLRASLGVVGNQAISAYETISRLSPENMVAGSTTLPGYIPTKLGQDNLGWESSKKLNIGIDFGIFNNAITGDINFYKSNTRDLLLNRTISPVNAVSSITQNIGEVENRGVEISLVSKNITTKSFQWTTSGNISFVKNKIVSLYGLKDANGKEINDVANAWFIGKPILVNYGYKWDGVWQLNEADKAAIYKTTPGFIKIKDISGPKGVPDSVISADYDRTIIGQRDPKFTWGMENSFAYKNLTLSVFMYGVHGVTKNNTLLNDVDVDRTVRMTTTKKNWWTPDNPTNEWYKNAIDANLQNGLGANPYEKAGFIRIKDISLSYDFAKSILSRFGFDKCQVYLTGRNLFTITKFGGMDPELSAQRANPLQKEYVVGISLDF